MALHLTLAKAQSMVEQVIAEKGADYVYPNAGHSCTYVDVEYTGEFGNEDVYSKGCIVGHIFINEFNLDLETLANAYVNDEGSNSFLNYLVSREYIETVDLEAGRYLNNLQHSQDAGKTWGEAHEKAKEGLTWSTPPGQWIKANWDEGEF